MFDLIRVLLVMGLVGWLMWWIISPPSRAVGQMRALIIREGGEGGTITIKVRKPNL